MLRILVLSPLKLEAEALKKTGLSVLTSGRGELSSALSLQEQALKAEPYDLVIGAGTAGALSPDARVGQVVLASEIVQLKPSKGRFHTDKELLEECRNLLADQVDLLCGPLLGLEEDVTSEQRKAELLEQAGAIAIAHESCGFARAARRVSIPYLELRVISDMADENAKKDFAQSASGLVESRLAPALHLLLQHLSL